MSARTDLEVRGRDGSVWTPEALAYLREHAIDPEVAAALGVTEARGALAFPCRDGDGRPTVRRRLLNGSGPKMLGESGRPLGVTYWRPRVCPEQAERLLVCEAEGDALAAVSAIDAGGDGDGARRFLEGAVGAVVSTASTSLPVERLVAEVQRVGARHVALAYDGDDAGRRAADRARAALAEVGVRAFSLALPEGTDLAYLLARVAPEGRAETLADALLESEESHRLDTLEALERRETRPPAEAVPARHAPWGPLLTLSRPAALPPFPLDVLPGAVGAWVRATAQATQTPPDLAAGAALAVASTAALGAAVVECAPGWTEELALYVLCALPSGERKSAVVREALAPLRALEAEARDAARPVVAQARAEQDALDARAQQLKREAAKGKADPAELAEVYERMAAAEEPVEPRWLADDATPEALAGLLARHGRLGVVSAESAVFDNLAGRYAEGRANVHLACQAYSGEEARVDRRNAAPEHLPRPLLALGLTVQPHVLRELTAHERMGAQGFLARFAYLLPTSALGARAIDPPPVSDAIRADYLAAVRRVATLRGSVGCVAASEGQRIAFGAEADEAFRAFRAAHETRLAPDADLGRSERLREWANRHPGRVARLAGLLHLLEHDAERAVGLDTMRAALTIGDYLLAHARAALNAQHEREQLARAVGWIRAEGKHQFSLRDLHRGAFAGHGPVDDVQHTVSRLCERAYLRERDARPPGPLGGHPPSPEYDVNPAVHEDSDGGSVGSVAGREGGHK